MNGLRRALGLGLRGGWRRWRPWPVGGGRAAPGGFSTLPSAELPLRGRGGSVVVATAAPGPREEEAFVFPEYVPEEPDVEKLIQREFLEEEEAKEALPRLPRLPAPPQPPGDLLLPKQARRRKPHRVTGRPDPSIPSSGVACSGCGAELHCRDPALPGYLPSAKYLSLLGRPGEPRGGEEEQGEAEAGGAPEKALEDATCQRCWLLVHHQQALRVQMTHEEYRQVVSDAVRGSRRHGRPPLVLCMADVLDLPDSLPPDLPELVGDQANILVLGNKVDLLPGDSPGYLKRLQERLLEACARVGLHQHSGGPNQRVVDVHLLSAKTGYGVEELISKMQRSWKFNGDVYLVGATNTGKSTLFNTLLQSDYCKSRASDAIHRATISPWPGQTELKNFTHCMFIF